VLALAEHATTHVSFRREDILQAFLVVVWAEPHGRFGRACPYESRIFGF